MCTIPNVGRSLYRLVSTRLKNQRKLRHLQWHFETTVWNDIFQRNRLTGLVIRGTQGFGHENFHFLLPRLVLFNERLLSSSVVSINTATRRDACRGSSRKWVRRKSQKRRNSRNEKLRLDVRYEIISRSFHGDWTNWGPVCIPVLFTRSTKI